jgi:hypothetical protein
MTLAHAKIGSAVALLALLPLTAPLAADEAEQSATDYIKEQTIRKEFVITKSTPKYEDARRTAIEAARRLRVPLKLRNLTQHPHLIAAAYAGGELVGLARATFDGLSAHVMEFSLDLRRQGGEPGHANGSLIEADKSGAGRRLGERLKNELEAMGASFITCYIVANCEEQFYKSLGFRENEGHLVYYIDKRPYVQDR